MEKVMLVDANAIAYRSLFSHELLSVKIKKKKIYTGMAFGFLKTLLDVKRNFSPNKIIIFWDGGSTRKKSIYPEYKMGRKIKTKDITKKDIINSFKICVKLIKYIGLEQYKLIGEEADDCISSYIFQNKNLYKFLILSNDHDFFQLLSKDVKLIRFKKGESIVWNKKKFIKEKNFKPKYYPHYLSLVGDSTDNVPGVKGIGPKAADKIFSQLKKPTIKNIYKKIDELDITDNMKNKILSDKEKVNLFFSLIELQKNLKLEKLYNNKQYTRKLINILKDLQFKSIYDNQEDIDILCSLR